MLKNYLTASLRHFARQRFFTFIHVAGLSLGMAAFLFIGLYIRHETSFDRHFPASDRLYRFGVEMHFGDLDGDLAVSPAPLKEELERAFPEVELVGRLREYGSFSIGLPGSERDHIKAAKVFFADPEVVDLFGLKLLFGEGETHLQAPNTLMMSRSLAFKVFGDASPVGQDVTIDVKYLPGHGRF